MFNSYYTTGTVTITSGSPNFTTSGAALESAGIRPGDIIVSNGLWLVIASITGQNSGTLTANAPSGAAGTGQPLRIALQTDASRLTAAQVTLISLLSGGNVQALAGLTGAANTGLHFTGAGAMATHPLTAVARTLLAQTTQANMRSAGLGLGSMATQVAGTGSGQFRTNAQNDAQFIQSAALPFENGSFTPSIEGITTPGSPSYNNQSGSYVKIGRMVLALVYMVITNLGGASGQLRIGGLPIIRANGTEHRAAMTFPFWSGLSLSSPSHSIVGFMQDTGNSVRLVRQSASSGSQSVTDSDVSGTITLYGTGIYEAAA